MKEKPNPIRKLYDNNKVIIVSSIEEMDFRPDLQISEDSIDLRLHPRVLKRKVGKEIDCLSQSFSDEFEAEFTLPVTGYVLKPGEMIYCKTLEKIKLNSRSHIGFVIAKQRVSAYGFSVLSDQFKSPLDLAWNFPLFIRNNSESDIKIYPFMYIAQLLLLPYPYGAPYVKDGIFNENPIVFQPLTGVEVDRIRRQHTKWEKHLTGYDFDAGDKKAFEKINDISKKRNPVRRFFSDRKNSFKKVGVLLPTSVVATGALFSNENITDLAKYIFIGVLMLGLIIAYCSADE